MLHPDRYFDSNPTRLDIARRLYRQVAALPLVCPHGHVDPRLLAEDPRCPDPASLIVSPDHYIFRMLYSQGVPLEKLGIPRVDGVPSKRIHARSGSFSRTIFTSSAVRPPVAG